MLMDYPVPASISGTATVHDDLSWIDQLGGAYECLFDLQLASIYRKYKALSLGNPCQRHYWIMRSYRARLTEIKLLRMGGSHV